MANFDAQIISSLTLYALDSAGRIPLSGNVVLRGCEQAIKSVAFTPKIDAGTTTTERRIDGKTCSPPPAVPIDSGYDVVITWCGQNVVFESITGFAELFMDGPDLAGFAATEYTPGKTLAMEIVLQPYGENTQTMGLFLPKVGSWAKTAAPSYDGFQRADAAFTGTTIKSSKAFDLYTTGDMIPFELEHWLTRRAPIVAGTNWYVGNLWDVAPTIDDEGAGSALSAIVPAGS